MEIGRDGEQRWMRVKKLGEGGFASVFLAHTTNQFNNTFLPSEFAVKSTDLSDSSNVSSLETEINILRALQGSPYVIGCYGMDVTIQKTTKESEPSEYLNVLLEYASLGSLKERINKNGGLPEVEVRHHTRCLLKGLKYIHDNGYVHCDLKPENILLVPSSDSSIGMIPKIADFGLASPVGQSDKERLGIKGTPVYLAPESVRWNKYEPKADVWGLGCIVLEMLSAKAPWYWGPDESVETLFDRIVYSGELPRIPDRISEDARDFLMRCFGTDDDDKTRFRGREVRWSIDMLMRHPFIMAEEDHHSHKVASPRSPLDSLSCSSCVTDDKTGSSSIVHSVINVLSSEGRDFVDISL